MLFSPVCFGRKENKKKIKIASVAGTKQAGNSEVTQFKGEDGVVYEAWGPELAAVLKAGEELECDIFHTTKTYRGEEQDVHRVQQIYINGKPVRPPRQGGGGGGRGGYGGKSDFQILVERTSTESQSAYNGVIELVKSGKADGWDEQVTTAKEYAELKMRDGMKPPPAAPVETKSTKPETADTLEKKSPSITEEMVIAIKKEADARGYKVATLTKVLSNYNVKVDTMGNLTVTQGNEIREKIKAGEGLA